MKTSRSSIDSFLKLKTLALAGVSRNGKKFGNTILKELSSQGYRISLIHPEAQTLGGLPCYPSLSSLPEPVEGLVIVLPYEQTERMVEEAANCGIKHIWMQQGAESPEAIAFCQEQGMNVVSGECLLMFANPKGFHKFHHWLWGLFGKLPV